MAVRDGTPAGDRLLLVMPRHQLARKASDAGFRLWSVWDPRLLDAMSHHRLLECSEELLLTDFRDEPGLRRLIVQVAARHDIATVLHCGGGASLLPVVEEAWRLGLSPNPPAAVRHMGVPATRPVTAPVTRLSVQTLTVAGRHQVVGVTLRLTDGAPTFATTGHLHPAPLPEADRSAAERLAVDWLATHDYRFGPAHLELVLDGAEARVVSGEPWAGPDRIPLLVEVARGLDVEAAAFAALRGHPAGPVPPAHQYAEIGFFPLPEGALVTYTGMELIAVTPWVRGTRFPYVAGDLVPPPHDPRAGRAYVVVEGATPQLTAERVRQAREDLTVEIRPPEAPQRDGSLPR
ncbi:phosphoribosylglycinamide synthetase [Streptomyces sp. DSM 44915]|uniref:Phosphoribosylglycinamide synthetase n=1 Tax=Streptomyces chisholmiae TaxID=3075540 RepID=A0ABU2JNU5_9ACTN|nr:phosphoribosylglycinamide synthetase [Streptomyces sp. DSM 44915]MDT0266572.1 phosphoribosylglycinamide synthetase [Streptomyces sp. DSM 44915]